MDQSSHTDRLSARKVAILDAAERLFSELGFEATSLNAVVELSGGSLATIYKLFGTKNGLFAEVVRRRGVSVDQIVREARAKPDLPMATLRRIYFRLHDRLFDEREMATFRYVISHGMADPDFIREFNVRTIQKGRDALTELFSELAEAGAIDIANPQLVARQFLDLIVMKMLSASLGMTEKATDWQADAEEELRLFARAIGLDQKGSRSGNLVTGRNTAGR